MRQGSRRQAFMAPHHLADCRIGFDTSSLNAIRDAGNLSHLLECIRSVNGRPLLSAHAIVEIVKWDDAAARRELLKMTEAVRGTGDFRLLPSTNQVVRSSFDAWAKNLSHVEFGEQSSIHVLQGALQFNDATDDRLVAACRAYSENTRSGLSKRLEAFRAGLASRPRDTTITPDAMFQRIRSDADALAKLVNDWLELPRDGIPILSADEAPRCLEHVPSIRALLATLVVYAHQYGILGRSSRRNAAGAMDIVQAVYLPFHDVFVVDDGPMRTHLTDVVRLSELQTRLLSHAEFVAEIGPPAQPGLRGIAPATP
jgi:hypothetical protein